MMEAFTSVLPEISTTDILLGILTKTVQLLKYFVKLKIEILNLFFLAAKNVKFFLYVISADKRKMSLLMVIVHL